MLLGMGFSRSSVVAWQVFEVRQAVEDRYRLLRVVHMQRWRVSKGVHEAGINIDETVRRVVGHQRSTTYPAELALAALGFAIRPYVIGTPW